MFPKIRWRIAATFVAMIAIVMGVTLIWIERPDCIGRAACIRSTLWTSSAIMMAISIILATIVSERTARPLRQLTHILQRIQRGDLQARMLTHHRDEIGTLATAFNATIDNLSQRQTTLSESRSQLAAILTYMADGVLIIDDSSLVRLINPAASRLLDTTNQEAIGRSYAEVVRHHQLIEMFQLCRTDNSEQVAAIEVGKDLFLQAIVTPFHDDNADFYLFILQDLTQIRRLETVRRDFISNLSHELRTPLTSLLAVVETLQDGAMEDPPIAHRFLSRAAIEVETMTQMVEELLELSRIESGLVPLRLTPTAVSDLVQFPIERLHNQASHNNITITLDLSPDLPTVLADAERVQRVVSNLLHNAIKFTPEGGTIAISAHPETNTAIAIAISDTGVGIPEKDLPRIFERFYKSDQARTRGSSGTGLGLAISRHIVQAHNGRISVKSKEGKGATFTFTLPIATAKPPQTDQP